MKFNRQKLKYALGVLAIIVIPGGTVIVPLVFILLNKKKSVNVPTKM